jgi:uncharacterized protein
LSVLVDTNILVHAVSRASPQQPKLKDYVERLQRSGELCLTWTVLYEWLRVVTHPRVFARPLSPQAAQSFVDTLASTAGIELLTETADHARFLRLALEEAPAVRGNLYHDVHIAALMREHGIRDIATLDRHFRLFPSLRVIDPLED